MRVPHEIARACAPVSKKRVIHVKLKSWLRPLGPTVPYLKINLISCFSYGIPGWLGLPSIQQPSCPPEYDLFGWSGKVQKGHSSRWWYLCGALEIAPQTCGQSPQCTLSMDIWCTTDNNHVFRNAGKCPVMLTCPLGVVIVDDELTWGHVRQTVLLQGKVPGDWWLIGRFRGRLLLTSRSFRFLARLKTFSGSLLKILLVVLSLRRIRKLFEMISRPQGYWGGMWWQKVLYY